MPLSEESFKILNEIKRGSKPAKFVLATSGADVAALVVYRRGTEKSSTDAAKDEAKAAGKSGVKVVCGVVDDKPANDQPANLSFKLLGTGKNDAPPVAVAKLKAFLLDGQKWLPSPVFDFVAALPAVDDGSGPPSRPTTTAPAQPPPRPNQSVAGAAAVATVAKLLTQLGSGPAGVTAANQEAVKLCGDLKADMDKGLTVSYKSAGELKKLTDDPRIADAARKQLEATATVICKTAWEKIDDQVGTAATKAGEAVDLLRMRPLAGQSVAADKPELDNALAAVQALDAAQRLRRAGNHLEAVHTAAAA